MDVTEPTLLLNEEICRNNIRRMAAKARKNDLNFKPHMKTHQSAEIGEWLKNAGASAITVSSVKMAQFFAKHGWNDITIAFPCNIRQTDEINDLASNISLTLLVSNIGVVQYLQKHLDAEVGIYIELDTGSARTGLQVADLPTIKKLVSTLNSNKYLRWIGFYSHPGHTYSARSKEEIREVHHSVMDQIGQLRENIEPEFGDFEVCIGDTPCCSVADNFGNLDAISPGNFVFYDLMQVQIGSCEFKDIATAVACPIVDSYPDRNELAIYGGAIHFSKEVISADEFEHFGLAAKSVQNGWKIYDTGTYLKSISQEHGLIKCSSQAFREFSVGDVLTILPVHSCLTANLMGAYTLPDGRTIQQF